MTKRKADYPQTEVELTPEIRELLEGFTQEIETGVVAGGFAPAEPGSEGIAAGLFEDLVQSLREAGAIMRGEREAARRTCFDEATVAGGGHGRSTDADSGKGDHWPAVCMATNGVNAWRRKVA